MIDKCLYIIIFEHSVIHMIVLASFLLYVCRLFFVIAIIFHHLLSHCMFIIEMLNSVTIVVSVVMFDLYRCYFYYDCYVLSKTYVIDL